MINTNNAVMHRLRLDDLPAPLPLMVLEELDDLISLDAARRSCKLFRDIFKLHGERLLRGIACDTLADRNIAAMFLYATWPWSAPGRLREGDRLRAIAARMTPHDMLGRTLQVHSHLVSACNVILQAKLDHLRLIIHQPLDNEVRAHLWTKIEYSLGPRILDPNIDLSPVTWEEEQVFLTAAWAAQFERDYSVQMPANRVFSGLTTTCRFAADDPHGHLADDLEEFQSSYYRFIDHDRRLACRSRPWRWDNAARCMPKGQRPDLSSGQLDETNALWSGRARDEHMHLQSQGQLPTASGGTNYEAWMLRIDDSVDWRVARRLGMGLWASKRMNDELQLIGTRHHTDPSILSSTWFLEGRRSLVMLILDEIAWRKKGPPAHLQLY